MKINQPVTDHEVTLEEGQTIVSKTDLKGIITYVNQDFVEVSGFGEQDLLGKNHNIVRHPDMPAAAFQDLWDTIGAGRPWTGLVKNRCKNGDYYWVEAQVTPVRQDGRIIEYLSVRDKPSRHQIDAAEALYHKVNEGKAKLKKSGFLHILNVLQKMRLWHKLAIAGGALLLPIAVLVFLLIAEKNIAINFAQKEIHGVEYNLPARSLAQHIAQHRGMTNALLNGDESFREKLLAKQQAIASDIEAIDAVDHRYGELLDASTEWQGIKSKWQNFKGKVLDKEPAESFSQHTEIIREILALITHVGDTSNLILDPDLDSYYLMDVIVVRLPSLLEDLGVLRGKGAGNAARQSISALERTKLLTLLARSQPAVEGSRRSMEVAFKYNAVLQPQLVGSIERFHAAATKFLDRVDKQIISTDIINVSAADYFDEGTQAIDAGFALYDAISPVLIGLLQKRIDGFKTNKYLSLGGVALAVLIALALSLGIIRAIQSSLRQALDVFNRIAGGDYRNRIAIHNEDEIGEVLRGLLSMQIKLGFDMDEANCKAQYSGRIKTALDNVSANVMVADSEHNIIYLNRALVNMFREAQADICKELPNFDVTTIVGNNIDSFHKNPTYQRRILRELQNSHRAEIRIGGRTFGFHASPVIDEQQQRIGTVVEWVDRTQELLVEDEVQSIVGFAKAGDLGQRVNLEGKSPFLRMLGEGINDLLDVSECVINDTLRLLAAVARGDLTESIDTDYQGTFGQLKREANTTVSKLTQVISGIKSMSDSVQSGAGEIAQGNTDLSQRTEEQAANLEQTASSMEQMTATVKQNADNARQANQLAVSTREQAEKGGHVVNQAVSAMGEINASSKRIADIIGVIDEIAFQTNLLALNAAVEAARAGEQGRGFAVVASEVRNLAQRSASAAKEIKELIKDSVAKVEEGSRLVDNSGQTLDEIVMSVKKVSNIIAEIAAASVEQSSGIEQVNKAVGQMDQVTQQNAALVEQAAAASEALKEQAMSMQEMMTFFRVDEHAIEALSGELKVSAQDVANIDLGVARTAHELLKSKIRRFLDGKDAIAKDQLISHRECDLGKWLYSEGLNRYDGQNDVRQLERMHQIMHETMRRIVELKQSGQGAQAEQEYQKIERISDRVTALLNTIECETKQDLSQLVKRTAANPVTPHQVPRVRTSAPSSTAPKALKVAVGGSRDEEWEEF